MEVTNTKYKNQGIHVISALFTVDKGITKILLIKRENEPYKNMWALTGGALYNDETLEEGMHREIKEKTGLENIFLKAFQNFSRVERSPVMRMIAVTYIGFIDIHKVTLLKQTEKTNNCDWFSIESLPALAYDHNEILEKALEELKESIFESDILKNLYPNGFTLPEIQKTYEAILEKELDRRNFRKKMLASHFIIDTLKTKKFEGNKPAKLYKFK
ncbi:MAG: NUDIX domain-containing protein [Bacilli bacterium]|nr:NUDIX domain-containing protein [Bacilli bacterium]